MEDARTLGVDEIEVLVTSPGRQAANGSQLITRIEAASGGVPVRLLSAQEEGRLGFLGAIAGTRGPSRRLVAVCDSLDSAKGLGGRRRADAQFHIEVAATAQSTRLYRAEVTVGSSFEATGTD